MSNTSKIMIGCFLSVLLVAGVIVGVVGYLGYSVYSTANQISVQATRLETINTTYPFTKPAPTAALDQKRFNEYMALRDDLQKELAKLPTILKLMNIMKDPNNPANNQDFGITDAFGMMGQIADVMEVFSNQLEKNKMSFDEYNYYKKAMLGMLYQSAKQGDSEAQSLFNEIEKIALQQTGGKPTNWAVQGQNFSPTLSLLGIDESTTQYSAQELQVLKNRFAQLKENLTLVALEALFMQQVQEQMEAQMKHQNSGAPISFPQVTK